MGFARSQTGLEYALIQDATGKTAAEIHNLSRYDRMLTALLRARWYREKKRASEKAQRKSR